MDQCCPLLSHIVTPNCKGFREMQSHCPGEGENEVGEGGVSRSTPRVLRSMVACSLFLAC